MKNRRLSTLLSTLLAIGCDDDSVGTAPADPSGGLGGSGGQGSRPGVGGDSRPPGGSAGAGDGPGGEAGARGCEFSIEQNGISESIPTVGIVRWSLSGPTPSKARIVYELRTPSEETRNLGGEAPVDLSRTEYETWLLGLKPSRNYRFWIEAWQGDRHCISNIQDLPTTGHLPDAPKVEVSVVSPEKRATGFIVTSSGSSLPARAFIIDADGDVVWDAAAPDNPTRALLDFEGNSMWMIELNLTNESGEMRSVSLDGRQTLRDVSGLEHTHHDFTVLPGGRIAALSWANAGIDPESEVLIRTPSGSISSAFRAGANLYRSESYHANAIHYHTKDDSFTIADRNPSVFVNVTRTGTPVWQLGGSCDGAPAAPRCVAQDWEINHGHHWLDDGTFVFFNNTTGGPAHVIELNLHLEASLQVLETRDYWNEWSSSNLGDVQRLPNGNTLISYATAGKIVEVDPAWDLVQTFTVRTGYTSWRKSLYGPPNRL